MEKELNFRADLLREVIRKNRLSQRKLAPRVEMSEKALSMKMNGVTEWTLSEIQRLQRELDGLDVNEIFKLKKL